MRGGGGPEELRMSAMSQPEAFDPTDLLEMIGQPGGGMDHHTSNPVPIERAKVGFVAGEEALAEEMNGRSQNGSVFPWKIRGYLFLKRGRDLGGNFQSCRQGLEIPQSGRELCFKIAPSFVHDIGIDDQGVTAFPKCRKESAHGTIAFGGRKQDVGIQKYPHRAYFALFRWRAAASSASASSNSAMRASE